MQKGQDAESEKEKTTAKKAFKKSAESLIGQFQKNNKVWLLEGKNIKELVMAKMFARCRICFETDCTLAQLNILYLSIM